jgi:nicotinate-nucleotide pyrophosphorylase (carboxylating)
MNNIMNIPHHILTPLIENAINEDIGSFGDLTSVSFQDSGKRLTASITTNQDGVISGLICAEMVFNKIDDTLNFKSQDKDADFVKSGTEIVKIQGNAYSILAGERTALNFLGHMSGIASETYKLVQMISDTKALILSTRKTTPGLRVLEKYAVKCGGGHNHRFGLDYGILIKDNHIKAAGSITRAIELIQDNKPYLTEIEVEVDTIEQFMECQELGVKYILLDNMNPEQIEECIKHNKHNSFLEASGGINSNTIQGIARTGVNYISIGRLTHSSPSLDLSLHIK